MLAVDEDDDETLAKLKAEPIPGTQLHVTPRYGYIGLHLYVNELSRMAGGDWLFLWNDDALMKTQAWDTVIEPFSNQMVVLNPETNHHNHPRSNCIFPIVPKALVSLLGHFSRSNHNDTYIEVIANSLGIRRDVPITILHDRADLTGSNRDEVFAQRQFTTAEFYGAEMQASLQRDIDQLRQFLKEQAR